MAVKDWSTTAASNTAIFAGISTDGTVMTVSQVDNAFREMAAQIASQLGKMGFEGADIASAATTNLANATGWSLDITGTTTITAFGTVDAGQLFILRFNGALTLTHNATSLILPGAANITTAAGDVAAMKSEGSGNWRCVSYQRASGLPAIPGAANTWSAVQTFSAGPEIGTFSSSGASAGKVFSLGSIANLQSSTTLTTTATHEQFFNPNGSVGAITTSGTATAYGTASDGRRKKNLRDFDSGGIIDALEAWLFDWTAGGTGYGIIAQDASEVFPDAIAEGEDGYLVADYSKFVPLLLAEVKKLRARVAALEA